MKKPLFYFIIIILFNIGCKSERKELCPTDELILINKAKSCYDGNTQVIINSKEEIDLICEKLENLSTPIKEVYVNYNKGFIEVFVENKSLYSVIFSEYNGAIIRYRGEYYKQDVLVNKSIKYLNMKFKKNPSSDCERFRYLNENK